MNRPNTPNWQVSINDPTVLLEDVQDIAQCVFLILSTIKGSDPLRPTFGSDVHTFLDMPMNVATPMLVYEVFTAIEQWEKRLSVKEVNVTSLGVDKKLISIKGTIISSSTDTGFDINL